MSSTYLVELVNAKIVEVICTDNAKVEEIKALAVKEHGIPAREVIAQNSLMAHGWYPRTDSQVSFMERWRKRCAR